MKEHRRRPGFLPHRWFLAATVAASIILISSISAAADLPAGGTFSDDDGLVHEAYIEALAAAGITDGCGPELFCPDQVVNRAELTAFVLRAAGVDVEGHGYQSHFTDVGADAWYTSYVERAYELGIMTGYDDSTFQPGAPVSRAGFAEILFRTLAEEVPSGFQDSYFSDVLPTVRYRPHVDRLFELGITRGCRSAPLMYCPDEPLTRAELASLLGRGFNLTPIAPPAATTTTDPPTTTTDCPPG